MADTKKTAAKAATKPYKVLRNILAAAPVEDDADAGTKRLHAYKLHRRGSTIQLDETDAAQQAALGHIEAPPKAAAATT
jgi:hypothetical protein